MRPIKLSMAMFGPYAHETTIDFGALGESGVFLITGDTGAGKTTIFDAIVYALYGRVTNERRSGAGMRSDYASPSEATFVELTFEHAGQIVSIRRSPSYERLARHGGTTRQEPKVCLTLPGRLPIENDNDVQREIHALLRLDYTQFKQVSMLAQGEFLNLLLAKSREREEIFRKLFGTHVCERLCGILRRRAEEKQAEVEQLEREMMAGLLELRLPETPSVDSAADAQTLLPQAEAAIEADAQRGEALRVQIMAAKADYDAAVRKKAQEEQAHALFAQLDEAQSREKALAARAQEADKRRQLLEKAERAEALGEAGAHLEAARRRSDEARGALSGMQERLKEIEERQKAVSEAMKTLPELNNRLETLTAQRLEMDKLMPRFEEREVCARDVQGQGRRFEGLKAQAAQEEEQLCRLRAALDKLAANIDEGVRAEGTLAQEASRKSELEKRIQDMERLSALSERLAKSRAYLRDCLERQRRVEQELTAVEAYYNESYTRYLASQAGLLARDQLREGQPCPVCGSTHHPYPAPISDEIPSSERLERLKKEAETRRAAREKLVRDNTELAAHVQEDSQRVSEMLEALGIENDAHVLAAERLKAGLQLRETTATMARLSLLVQRVAEDRRRQETGKVVLSQAEAQQAETQKALSQQGEALAAARERLKALTQALGDYAAADDARSALSRLVREQKQLQERIDTIREAARLSEQAQSEIAGRINGLKQDALEAEERAQQAFKAFDEALRAQGFAGETDWRAARLENEQRAQLRDQLSAYDRQRALSQADIERLKAETAGKTADHGAQEQANQVSERLESLRREQADVLSRRERNARQLERMRDVQARYLAAGNDLARVRHLGQLSEGRMTQKQRVSFEQYVQRGYLEQVLVHANRHLLSMTDGRFELRRREQLEKLRDGALELNVMDYHSGRERAAASLSGGEAFLASLSMALGLSETIAEEAGGVQIDTLFVDEGFGSLDPAALDQAVSTLLRLGEGSRLVGIVSHVEELRRRVPRQIVVEAAPDRGSRARVLCD